MRNMIQLLGGVAVAGVVAAGSTAFTAGSGLTATPATAVVGGTASVAVSGANIGALTFVHDADPNSAEITLIHLTLKKDDGSTAITTGTLTLAVTAGAGTAAPTCAYSSGNTRWECTPSADWTTITQLAFKYLEA
ncbi:hypothetical protein Ait01nite_064860 [Actinoplanes italicus]|uniref:Uncharacterized protein n=1 Tax=Actinoplanes italicus TaxID=113567 RepID=A0A2T0KQ50_9ACTN|nr:hypothetical protein [Actinoplanes italicus]PRX25856.1 hypothetical protein CLV67_101577 [Actinoplanes italicus]GIE33441.1 hypothetical protein Ait01nite_064860 [Actinoplanes italicus]